MSRTRRALTIDDLHALAQAQRAGRDLFAAVDALAGETIGHRLFTIMRFDAARCEVERVYTSNADAYPLGGRKRKAQTAWADHVLIERRVFRGDGPDAIRAAFDDHAKIFGLGLGSILNIPVAHAGRCLGTMNLCHRAGWFSPQDEQTGLLLAAFLVPALLAAA